MNMSRTNPLGKGTRNLAVNVTDKLHSDLLALARASSVKLGEYCRVILRDAVEKQIRVERGGYLIIPKVSSSGALSGKDESSLLNRAKSDKPSDENKPNKPASKRHQP